MSEILILGASISAGLAAAWLRKRLPKHSVTAVGRLTNAKRPIVGESTVSVTSRFLQRVGLGKLLAESHFPKYALSYYFKRDIDAPEDPTYYLSESPYVLPELSFNLNRFSFDRQLRAHNEARGVRYVDAKIIEITLGEAGDDDRHRVLIEHPDGRQEELRARWIIDASGRNRLLARKLDLTTPPRPGIAQRSAFWFRLEGFDREILYEKLDIIKKPNFAYDPYYVTHHFLGRGNWIWAIPIRSEGSEDLISIGMCLREDLTGRRVGSIDDFLDLVQGQHPVIAELVRSGRVVDQSSYRNYMYDSKRIYFENGCYIIGDAAQTVDPLYSTGIATTTIQVEQVAEMIARDGEGRSTSTYVRTLERALKDFHWGSQSEISDLYTVMHDRYQAHLRMHAVTYSVFHVLIPFVANGYFHDEVGARLFSVLMGQGGPTMKDVHALNELIALAKESPAGVKPEDYVDVQNVDTYNIPYLERFRDEHIPASMSKLMVHLIGVKLKLLRKAGLSRIMEHPKHLVTPLQNAAVATVMGVALRGRSLRKSGMVQRVLDVVDRRATA